jgi:hypothetical protein
MQHNPPWQDAFHDLIGTERSTTTTRISDMAFRDRGGQEPTWDSDSDVAPPIWDERTTAPRNARGRDDSFGDLPAWSKANRAETTWEEDEAPIRNDRQPVGRSERQADSAPWPSLRDSLRGHAGTSQGGQRTSRFSSTPATAPPARPRPGRIEQQPIEDDYAWPDDVPKIQAEVVPYEEPKRSSRRAAAATTRTQTRARRSVTSSTRPPVGLSTRLGSLTAGQDAVIVGSVGLSIFSLLVMAAVVSMRTDAVSPWFVTHINAAGDADRWATSDAIWRLPLMMGVMSLASIAASIYVGRRDPFASRFLMASMLLIHLLGWIGLVRILW